MNPIRVRVGCSLTTLMLVDRFCGMVKIERILHRRLPALQRSWATSMSKFRGLVDALRSIRCIARSSGGSRCSLFELVSIRRVYGYMHLHRYFLHILNIFYRAPRLSNSNWIIESKKFFFLINYISDVKILMFGGYICKNVRCIAG